MDLYLAGPDVFRPDALAWAENARAQVAARGHRALLPLDNEATTAEAIYRANVALIARADAVLACVDPFRGAEPDAGTAFEIGHALALGKPVIAYLADARPQAERLIAAGLARRDDAVRDGQGWTVEDFGLPVNLMIAIPCTVVQGGLSAALDAVERLMPRPGKPWFLYLLECADGSIYTGITTDVAARYAAHCAGKGARYTRAHPPVALLGVEQHPDRSAASKAEYRIKQLSPRDKRAYAQALAPVSP